jgi:hypothetical protein
MGKEASGRVGSFPELPATKDEVAGKAVPEADAAAEIYSVKVAPEGRAEDSAERAVPADPEGRAAAVAECSARAED